jgi:hypothetical protein
MKQKSLPDCMNGAGFLGHTWCVTEMYGEHERLRLQACEPESAVKVYDELGDRVGSIYRRHSKGWERVTRSAASIA